MTDYLATFEADYRVSVEHDGDDEPSDEEVKQALQDELGFAGIIVTEVIWKGKA